MARNNQPLIIGAAAVGGLALLATLYTVLNGNSGPPVPPGGGENAVQAQPALKTVYVARRDIPPRTALTSDLFAAKDVPEAEVPPGAVTDLNELRGLLSKQPIKIGDTATGSLTTPAVRRVVPANIAVPQGLRAVAIYVNPDQTAAGLVDVGDRVDVIATHKFALVVAPNTRIEGASQISTGRVIGQDLQVLAVDKSIAAPTPAPAAPTDPSAAGAPPPPGAPVPPAAPTPAPAPGADVRTRVLLAAPLDIAARLVAAGEEGKLHVVIRNPTGADRFPVPEVREYPSRLVAVPPARTNTGSAPAASGGSGGSGSVSRLRDENGGSGGYGGSSRRRNSGSSDSLPDLPVPQVETVPPARLPSGSGNSGGSNSGLPAPGLGNSGGFGNSGQRAPIVPPVPQENEVTVIRGTEKTRVLVPR